MAFIDFSQLSDEELTAEILREEEILEDSKEQLSAAKTYLDEITQLIKKEQDIDRDERIKTRREAIQNLEDRISDRQQKIEEISKRLTIFQERLYEWPLPIPIRRLSILESIRKLIRVISSYEGWQTRDRRSLGAYRGWIKREQTYIIRLAELRSNYEYYLGQISTLTTSIREEEAFLKQKHEILETRIHHVTVTANVDTESEGVIIIISISLDYDVRGSRTQYYLTYATTKIRTWFKSMFYGSITAEPSATYSDTPPEIIRELISRKEEVTPIFYDWYWRRRGVFASPGEKDSGDMTWDEDIPLGERAGAKRGRKKK